MRGESYNLFSTMQEETIRSPKMTDGTVQLFCSGFADLFTVPNDPTVKYLIILVGSGGQQEGHQHHRDVGQSDDHQSF